MDAPSTSDTASNRLAEIRERNNKASYTDPVSLAMTADDVPLLLAAADAALKKADEWKQFATPGDAQDECADELRETITAALSGPGTAEGIAAASIDQQSAYRNELRHLPGYMSRPDATEAGHD